MTYIHCGIHSGINGGIGPLLLLLVLLFLLLLLLDLCLAVVGRITGHRLLAQLPLPVLGLEWRRAKKNKFFFNRSRRTGISRGELEKQKKVGATGSGRLV